MHHCMRVLLCVSGMMRDDATVSIWADARYCHRATYGMLAPTPFHPTMIDTIEARAIPCWMRRVR